MKITRIDDDDVNYTERKENEFVSFSFTDGVIRMLLQFNKI